MSENRRGHAEPPLEVPSAESPEKAVDEVLEALWTESERGAVRREDLTKAAHVPLTDDLMTEVESRGLVRKGGHGSFEFTEEGFRRARAIIRRHRLAERLVHDILEASREDMEANACEFEHVLAPGITESICTLLGHPTECPHGKPIPDGRCCREARRSLAPVLVRADQLRIGEAARMAYISTKSYARLQKLSSFGFSPGVRIKLHQRRPAFVFQCEETQLALEESLAREIFVLRES